MGQYYSQFKIDKEKRQKEQHRKEIEEKMKHTLLPDEMKRDLINKKVEARFPNKSPSEGHNLSQNSLNERQVFENLDGVPRMAINNQPQNVDFMIMRNENMNRPPQMLSQLPNQMQREIQGKRQGIMEEQIMKQIPMQNQNQMAVTITNKIPQQINNQRNQQMGVKLQRRGMQNTHIPREQILIKQISRNQIPGQNSQRIQDIPLRGRNFPISSSSLSQNSINRNTYNPPNIPQNSRILQHQRNFDRSPSSQRE